MKLIDPSFEILDPDLDFKKAIEVAGRTCYKSEDKITETSAEDFVSMLIKNGHGAMLEHGTIYLAIPWGDEFACRFFEDNVHSYSIPDEASKCDLVTANYRVFLESGLDGLDNYVVKPDGHLRRYSVKFICDRGVANEFVRHRVFSFAQESTRFCNYTKSKFDGELTFIKPSWFDKVSESFQDIFTEQCGSSEELYKYLINEGFQAQEARNVLPLALKTELIMTGFGYEWEDFFKLRCAPNAHPDALLLTKPLQKEFMNRYYILPW